jgi:ATP-dependent Clp protease ATP-binding subunit ClpC
MFERFTERSRRVVVLAQEEARMLDHNYIGSEHILLGLIHEGAGIAAQAIESTGLTLAAARAEVERTIGRGGSTPTGHIPFTPRAKKVLELALREALALKKSYIGPEHILLGMIREGGGFGAEILTRLAVPLPVLRVQVMELAAAEPSGPNEPLGAQWLPAVAPGAEAVLAGRTRVVLSDAAETRMVRGLVVGEFRSTLASLGETLDTLSRRLTAIERQLANPTAPTAPTASAEESRAPEESVTPGKSAAAPEEEPPAGNVPG